LNSLIEKYAYKTNDVRLISTLKATQMPLEDRRATEEILKRLGLKGELGTRSLATHGIDAVATALKATPHLKNQTEATSDEGADRIIVPKERNWRTLTK